MSRIKKTIYEKRETVFRWKKPKRWVFGYFRNNFYTNHCKRSFGFGQKKMKNA